MVFIICHCFVIKHSLPFVRNNHCLQGVQTLLQACSWELHAHLPFSLVLSPCDYFLLTLVKDPFCWCSFDTQMPLTRLPLHCYIKRNQLHLQLIVLLLGVKCVHHNVDCFLWEIDAGVVYYCLYNFILAVAYRIFLKWTSQYNFLQKAYMNAFHETL